MDRARSAATEVVFEVNERGAYSNIALTKVFRTTKFKDIDRRFCTELVNGTVKCGASLDWIIGRYVNRPLSKIDPRLMAILRVGVYQLRFLDRVPASAAVNESVELAKSVHEGAAKFVNAVLRSMLREPSKGLFPTDDSARSLALRTFHPKWLVERWIEQFGLKRTKALLRADNRVPPLTLRVNLLRTTRAEMLEELRASGVDARESKLAAEGIVCRNVGALDNFAPLKDGLCLVQDESSMLAAHVLEPKSGEFVIDCCAAPGGKSTHIAELMGDRGMVVAADVHEHKVRLIGENATRLKLRSVKPMLIDAREIGGEFRGRADRVLVDAPCSGLGVLRRKADLRWKKTPADLDALPELQAEILSSAARALKAGGVLVYSTCTLERAENEGVVEKFLSGSTGFELIEQRTLLPIADGDIPEEIGSDGFFYAKLIKAAK